MSSNPPIDNYCLPPERTTTRGPPQHHHQSNAFLWPHWPPQRRPDVYQWSIGECISYDNVGPINPESIEGYRQFIAFRDTRSKYLFATPSKLATRRPSSANYASFKATTTPHSGPKRPTSFTKSINAADTKAPHHTNNGRTPLSGISRLAILSNVSATIHRQDFLRADVWAHALSHWTRLHNSTPHTVIHDTPSA